MKTKLILARTARATSLLSLLLPLAAPLQAGDFTYSTNKGAITITHYNGSGGAVSIPDTINGFPVTTIGKTAFFFCPGLTSVTIPTSVTRIAGLAFSLCSKLTNITIPDTITYIEDYAFDGCGLTSLTLSNTVTRIGNNGFSHCLKLASITIPSSVTTIGEAVFDYCTNLNTITVDALNPAYASADGILFNKSQTTLIQCPARKTGACTLPNRVASIAEGAFSDCASLEAIEVDAVNSFYSSVDGILFNKSRTMLIQYPRGKAGSTYTIPRGITNIEGRAFYSCTRLTNVTIPATVTSMGTAAFAHCRALLSVTIPESVTHIESDAFSDCTSLTTMTIPDGVTSLGSNAFSGCRKLTTVTVGNHVSHIAEGVFGDCRNLTALSIPDSVSSIGKNTFHTCNGLTNLTIGNRVSHIGDMAFYDCRSLTSLTLPASVTTIGIQPFFLCYKLESINVDPLNSFYSSVDGVLFNRSRTTLIQYPRAKAGTTYTIPNTVTTIGDNAFPSSSKLTSISIPAGVTKIGEGAFFGCTKLRSITIPAAVTSIGAMAFGGCENLTAVYFEGNAPSLGREARSFAVLFGETPLSIDALLEAEKATVYYLPGTKGWGPIFGGCPTAVYSAPAKPAK